MKKFFILFTGLLAFQLSFGQTQKGNSLFGTSSGDESGYSVSMPNPTTVAIGAPYDGASGSARVFTWNGSAWVQKGGNLIATNNSDFAGSAVSMPDENTIAVSATGENSSTNLTNAGRVRIYRWNGTAWTQKGSPIDGDAQDDFSGFRVDMPDSNTVAISSVFNDDGGTDAGQVRIFTWNGSSWVQKGNDIDGDASFDELGRSLSMPDANTIAIGSPYSDNNGSGSGHVEVFTWNGSAWVSKGAKIVGQAAINFAGHSVSMPDANTLAVGAISHDGSTGSSSGQVRIFTWDGTAWVQKGSDIDGELAFDQFGYSVDMPNANTLAAGAMFNDNSNGSNTGHVRIFDWAGTTWTQRGTDIDGTQTDAFFGEHVSMGDSNTVAIGARLYDSLGTDRGMTRIYQFCNPATGTDVQAACGSYTWIDGNTYTASNNSATFTIAGGAANGCDSTVTLDLTINSVDSTVTLANGTLTANQAGAAYQWLDCDNGNAAIAGATAQSYSPASSGNYAVEVTANGCTATSACTNVTISTINKHKKELVTNIFPNPTTQQVTIQFNTIIDVKISLISVDGKELQQQTVNTQQVELEMGSYPAGLYILQVQSPAGIEQYKVIKQ